jgi:hypothetical protein
MAGVAAGPGLMSGRGGTRPERCERSERVEGGGWVAEQARYQAGTRRPPTRGRLRLASRAYLAGLPSRGNTTGLVSIFTRPARAQYRHDSVVGR